MLALATTDIVSSIALYEIMKLSLTLDVCLFKKLTSWSSQSARPEVPAGVEVDVNTFSGKLTRS